MKPTGPRELMRHTTSWNVNQGARSPFGTYLRIRPVSNGTERRTFEWLTFRTMKRKWLLPVCLIALLVVGGGVLWHTGVLHRISNRDHLIALLRQGGSTGALLCIAVQFLQVVIAVIPGEVTSSPPATSSDRGGGSSIPPSAITLGSAFNFWFARVVGRPSLERLIGRDRLAKIDRALASAKSRSAMFLLFLLPGLPRTSCATRRVCRACIFSSSWCCRVWPLAGPARERPDRRRCVARRLSFGARDRAANGAGHRRVLLVPSATGRPPSPPAVVRYFLRRPWILPKVSPDE